MVLENINKVISLQILHVYVRSVHWEQAKGSINNSSLPSIQLYIA